MQIEKLQIELRPRSPAQALDLGFALLRTCPYHAHMAYAVLLLPFALLAALLTVLVPQYAEAWVFLPWWIKPAIERGTLYVLSRQVFGTQVSWQEAVRAWPRQLGGGTFRMLTWFRFFSAGRSLVQPVWQLENARGKVASERRRTLGANGTARSAFWCGMVFAMFETVLQIGTLYFLQTMFGGDDSNAFLGFWESLDDTGSTGMNLAHLAVVCAVSILVGPMYTACGFALYLNRRAALEAWDIEIALRQIVRPAAATPATPAAPAAPPPPALRAGGVLSVLAATALCWTTLAAAPDAMAKPATQAECLQPQAFERLPATTAEQQRVRQQVDALYARDALTSSRCVERWVYKDRDKRDLPEIDHDRDGPDLQWLASLLKVAVIAGAIGIAAWLLYRYRAHFPTFKRSTVALATEVGGLDIRAESLPPQVSAEVLQLWAAGQHRAALALLYRATLSRLVTDDHLQLRQGDTEGDCLRLARHAGASARLTQGRLDVTVAATGLWLDAAYGNRWPAHEQVAALCSNWDAQFPSAGGSAP